VTGPGLYLCGCSPSGKRSYRLDLDGRGALVAKTGPGGVEVCPEHGVRLYGWRTSEAQAAGLIRS
jgi:hypothetical protein